jgi:hypothetical protein
VTYCEAGQRECEYLGFVEEAGERVLIDRGTEERLGPEFSALTGNVIEEWINASQSGGDRICTPGACGIIKQAIVDGITSEVRYRFDDLLREKNGS